jgi:hypothetical protein
MEISNGFEAQCVRAEIVHLVAGADNIKNNVASEKA